MSREGVVRHLEPKAVDLLVCLAERAPQVVSKEVLIERVWAGTFVVEESLKRVVSGLRKALEDDARRPRVIETIPKRGYRLIAPLGRAEPGAQAANSMT